MRYRVGTTQLVVTKPTGEIVQREVMVAWDEKLGLHEVIFKGESPLKGYIFGVLGSELARVREAGTPTDEAPRAC